MDQKFDFIVSRAVTNMSKFKKYASGKINTKQKNKIKNGILYLMGGDLDKELSKIEYKTYNISDYFDESFSRQKK